MSSLGDLINKKIKEGQEANREREAEKLKGRYVSRLTRDKNERYAKKAKQSLRDAFNK